MIFEDECLQQIRLVKKHRRLDKMLVHKVNYEVVDSSMFSGSLGSEGNKRLTPNVHFPEKIKTISELQTNNDQFHYKLKKLN